MIEEFKLEQANNEILNNRGKFVSLTLINWNGFFARTFDLDEMVTTLSGGNGAGKSTTMAAFVTALIPDLTLLHFRNTTEAGATTGSKDKGLHGKLKPGICYAILDCINSKKQRVIVGVRLQQIVGRDKKVDLKAFTIQGLPAGVQIISLFTNKIDENKAKILSLDELKQQIENAETAEFKAYNSITEYHNMMFDYGIISKKLRTAGDRAKYYRLIEASLYGGISSAITRSLRSYLLPENTGVKQAFQDMEGALRENRMTLAAIKATKNDRDLFKNLITESTNYVAADYIRHFSQRKTNIENTLLQRRELASYKSQLLTKQQTIIDLSKQRAGLEEHQHTLEIDVQAAQTYLASMLNALQQQQKIERFSGEVDELEDKLAEQNELLAESTEQLASLEETYASTEEKTESLRNQLADQKQALDSETTRSLQYQQAKELLVKAQELSSISEKITVADIPKYHQQYQAKLTKLTEQRLELEQKFAVSNMAKQHFETAYSLVQKIVGDVARDQAWQVAKQILRDYPTKKMQASQADSLHDKLNQLEDQKLQLEQQQQLLHNFNQQYDLNITDLTELNNYYLKLESELAKLTEQLTDKHQTVASLNQEQQRKIQQSKELKQQLPAWILAQNQLNSLVETTSQEFNSATDIMAYSQNLIEQERQFSMQRDQVAQQKEKITEQIQALSSPDGANDQRLSDLAIKFGGTLLTELYDDLAIEDAPYFAAMYGPASYAIVVKDLSLIEQQLADLEDCPENIYFIQGDPDAFDDNVYHASELNDGVVVSISDRQLRYSKFPHNPVFGKASRDERLTQLRKEQDQLINEYANLAFEVQKIQHQQQKVTDFIGKYLNLAFQADIEQQLTSCNTEQQRIQEQLQELKIQINESEQVYATLKSQLQQLNSLAKHIEKPQDVEFILEQIDELQEQLEIANEELLYVKKHEQSINKLESIVDVLQADPQEHSQLKQEYEQVCTEQQLAQQQSYCFSELVHRIDHFDYKPKKKKASDAEDLSHAIREQLNQSIQKRDELKQQLKQQQKKYNEINQLYLTFTSTLQAKANLLQELQAEVAALGIKTDKQAQERATQRKDMLMQQLQDNRNQVSELDKQLLLTETQSIELTKSIDKIQREYKQNKAHIIDIKRSWAKVQTLIREYDLEKYLYKKEFAYLDTEELRSISDKALGALRTAVNDNEYLRDGLRLSEDLNKLENKVQFFVLVYKHLQERIRQDILSTQDPIQAIEQMEIELAKLTEELKGREQKLSISAESVANIMRKTIQREQNRIKMLNQGLQNISFGQVNSVRLVVNIKETHLLLLSALSQGRTEHQDLFTNNQFTFSEAIAKLYQRVNPQIEMGQKTPQVFGEELLDYRNYLELAVEVYRGTDGWLRAESGALSTGEAIGTGMSILLMVIQSWEEEGKYIRSKNILPCRLLFLDEAARLDAKSIATLFELCERLDMQLIIAAPENISPEKGTTYKLVRKTINNQEHVHVVGLRGFGQE